jgi:hypothetical protein
MGFVEGTSDHTEASQMNETVNHTARRSVYCLHLLAKFCITFPFGIPKGVWKLLDSVSYFIFLSHIRTFNMFFPVSSMMLNKMFYLQNLHLICF